LKKSLSSTNVHSIVTRSRTARIQREWFSFSLCFWYSYSHLPSGGVSLAASSFPAAWPHDRVL
jgi:hypothetical protein